MKERRLGQSNLMLSPLGIGTWQFSNSGGTWDQVNEDTVYQILQYALSHGMNWIDTAEIYGNGISESMIGKALKRLESEQSANYEPFIATKWFPVLRSAKSIPATIQKRLDCLQRQVIDLYQIHQPTSRSPLKKQMHEMANLVERGLIKNIGVSNFTASGMRKADRFLQEYGLRLASNQVKYNLLHRKPEKNRVLDTAKELGISIIAYSPLQQGVLTGRFHKSPDDILKVSKLRKFHSHLGTKELYRTQPLIETLEKLGKEYGKTPAQISLNWLIHSQGDVVFAIPGATKLEQMKSNVEGLSFELSHKDIELLNKVSESL